MANFKTKHVESLLYFSKKKNIHPKRFLEHELIDDLDILFTLREAYWKDMTVNEQAFWGSVWGNVFYHNRSLSNESLVKIQNIVESMQTQERKMQRVYRIIRESKEKQHAV